MMNIINIIGAIIVSVGFGLTIFSKDSDKRRYVGWLMMAMSISIFGMCDLIHGSMGSAIFDFGIGLIDFWLAYFWYGIYKEKVNAKEMRKLNDKERFLKEIMRFRK